MTIPRSTIVLPGASRRRDIQGLRAIAVLAVVANHLLGWPAAGFVGVDIFFVISGFIITSMLLAEESSTGRISIREFYARRARRILPAALVVLGVTVAASFLVFRIGRASAIAADAFWAAIFSSNWNFAARGVDYWTDDYLTSPFQHFWSLSIEEQFYFAWPAVIIAVFSVRRRRAPGSGKRVLLAWTIGVIVAASLAWALYESASNPTFAYFSTFSRVWELGTGAAIAVAAPFFESMRRSVRLSLGWLGLIGIVTSFVVVGKDAFPAPWALLPVLATAAVVVSGIGAPRPFLVPLTNRLAGYIGDISYSLYLWHFPVITIVGILLGTTRVGLFLSLVLVIALSVASYHLIENPIRRSTLFSSRERSPLRNAFSTRTAVAGCTAVVVAIAAVGGVGVQAAVPPTTTVAISPEGTLARDALLDLEKNDPAIVSADRESALENAIDATSFPELSPSIDSLGFTGWAAEAQADGCTDVDEVNYEDCVTGPSDHEGVVVVLGDSYAMAWMPGIRTVFEKIGWKVQQITLGQCPAAAVDVVFHDGSAFTECQEHREWALQKVRVIQPDLVIIGDARNTMDRLASGALGDDAAGEIRQGLHTTIETLAPLADRIAILGSPPETIPLQVCATHLAGPAHCLDHIGGSWWQYALAERLAVEDTTAEHIDTRLWFCSIDDLCPGFAGTTPIRTDGGHLTAQYSALLAPELENALLGD